MADVRIVLDSRIRIAMQELRSERVVGDLEAEFTHDNPAYSPNTQGGAGEPPQYKTFDTEPTDWSVMTLPRGGLSRVRDVLRAHGLTWTIQDDRVWRWREPGFPDHLKTARNYQDELIDAGVRRQNCLLHAPTGSGKTTALYGLLARLKRRSLVMVWSGNLLQQWRERCVEELGFEPGVVREDQDGGHPWLDIAMQQTVANRFERGDTDLAERYDVVACDEVQRFAAPTLFASVDPFRSRYRIGVSADHTRKDGKEFLTRDLFGDVACDIDQERLIAAGAIVEVEVCVVPTEFRAPWYRYRQDFTKLLGQMVKDEARNELALRIAQREMDEGEQVLLFTHRVEHARSLDAELVGRGYRSGVMLGGKPQAVVFARTVAGLKSTAPDRKMCGVGTYVAIAQGLDLPSVGRGVCITPIGSNRQMVNQAKGRLCRSATGKGSGRLYYLHDRHVYGRRVIENLIKSFRVRALWNGEWIDGAEYVRQLRLAA